MLLNNWGMKEKSSLKSYFLMASTFLSLIFFELAVFAYFFFKYLGRRKMLTVLKILKLSFQGLMLPELVIL